MSTSDRRKPQPFVDAQSAALLIVGGSVVLLALLAWGAAALGSTLAGVNAAAIKAGPIEFVKDLAGHTATWPVWSTVLLVVFIVGAIAAVVGVLSLWSRLFGRRRTRVDSAARLMGAGRDIAPLTQRSATQTAQRLGVNGNPGVPIGRALAGNLPLFGSWEDMHVDVWGPRTGKTTSRAVPAILDAPGAVLVTSNKRDVVDATRDVRLTGPVWVFDPQGIANETPSWWWNPLSYVTDEVRAAKLAEHFAAGSRDPGARTDAFFDPAGQDLLAGLLLAAALDRRPITDVYTWLTRPWDEAPAQVLRAHGFPLTADQVEGVIGAPEKQRGGIYGTAQQMASCLTNRTIAAWITPAGGNVDVDARPQFDPEVFVHSSGTLYSLSKEGRGTAGPLVTALTVAVIEAAEELAARSPMGRLQVPLLGVLDEAANVCRWRELPNLYSHFGSKGIILMTILQSWSQGCEVWGEAGMRKLWSAANIRVYGGGGTTNDGTFLADLARMIGDYDRQTSSTSTSREGHRTVSVQSQRDRILDDADLAALPKGRAVVIASGARPTLIRTQPWMAGPHSAAVRASIVAHDPQGVATIREAESELAQVAAQESAA